MKLRKAAIGAAILALIVPSIAFAQDAPKEETAPEKESVSVDFAKTTNPVTYRASGFLHAMSTSTPATELVDQLKPQTFRMAAPDWHNEGTGAFANYNHVKKLGAKLEIVVSDSHGYHLAGWWPGDNDECWTRWDMVVEGQVKTALSRDYTVQWDIWNEPNLGGFWKPDRDRFFETWKRGYNKIRSLDPKAEIIGPSISGFDPAWIEAFLTYARDNKVLPNILSWHAFCAPKTIVDNVKTAREIMAKLGIKELPISLNEVLTSDQTMRPGATAGYLANLEKAEVVGACHACWNDQGCSACENNSLDGILTTDKKPRAPWWVYKSYADMTGTLVEVTPCKKVDLLASKDAKTNTAYVLLGRNTKAKEPVTVELNLLNMKSLPIPAKKGKVHVTAKRIPPSGFDALAAPTTEIDADQQVKNGQLTINLPNFGGEDAYFLTITAAGK